MLHLQSIPNYSLELKIALYSSTKQLLRLCKIDCKYIILEIDLVKVYDDI